MQNLLPPATLDKRNSVCLSRRYEILLMLSRSVDNQIPHTFQRLGDLRMLASIALLVRMKIDFLWGTPAVPIWYPEHDICLHWQVLFLASYDVVPHPTNKRRNEQAKHGCARERGCLTAHFLVAYFKDVSRLRMYWIILPHGVLMVVHEISNELVISTIQGVWSMPRAFT